MTTCGNRGEEAAISGSATAVESSKDPSTRCFDRARALLERKRPKEKEQQDAMDCRREELGFVIMIATSLRQKHLRGHNPSEISLRFADSADTLLVLGAL